MRENFIKILALAIAVLVVLAAYTLLRQNEINEIITEEKAAPITLRILSDTSSGTSPLTVNFKPLLLNNKNTVEYLWEFGDGNTSSEKQPVYIYRNSGIFNCKLTVKYANKTIDDDFNITAFPNNPPKIKILCKTSAFIPEILYFDVEVFDPEGEDLEYNWVLKYPVILGGIERKETFNTKNFSKRFIRKGAYVLELTVTDASGNKVTDYEVVRLQQNKFIAISLTSIGLLFTTLPNTVDNLWNMLAKPFKVDELIYNKWFDIPSGIQKLVNKIINLGGANRFIPPIPKADLLVSDISDINLSAYIDNVTGEVSLGAFVTSAFTIFNNDSKNIAKSVYIRLKKPYSNEEGLDKEIAFVDLVVGLDDGVMSNKMFYNGEYTNWTNCYNIEKLVPGDLISLGITVTLMEGAIFNKGTYQCTLYIYQDKHLHKAEVVDEIPFTIVI